MCAGSVLSHCSGVAEIRGSVRRLCLFLCGRLTDSDVRPIERFTQLTSIDVGGCHALTDEALQSISAYRDDSTASRPRALQWLSLYWCPGLTDKVSGEVNMEQRSRARVALSTRSHALFSLSACALLRLWTQGVAHLSAGLDCAALRHLSLRSVRTA